MEHTRRRLLTACATGIGLTTGGCIDRFRYGRDISVEYDVLVEMHDSSFEPETVSIESGDTIVWYNVRGGTHTVTAYEEGIPSDAEYFASGVGESEAEAREVVGSFSSERTHTPQGDVNQGGSIPPDGWYYHTFHVPGEYRYFCIPHEHANMIGTVVVES